MRPPTGDDGYSVLKLPSGEQRLVLSSCMATIGVLSNPQVGQPKGRNQACLLHAVQCHHPLLRCWIAPLPLGVLLALMQHFTHTSPLPPCPLARSTRTPSWARRVRRAGWGGGRACAALP